MFHVYVDGVTRTEADAVRLVAEAMAARYGLPAQEFHGRLLKGRFRVKAHVDRLTADTYAQDLRSIGARVRIEPAAAEAPSSPLPVSAGARPAPSSPLPVSAGARPAPSSPLPVSAGARPAPSSPLPVSAGARPAPSSPLPVSAGARPAPSSPLPVSAGARPAPSVSGLRAPKVDAQVPLSSSPPVAALDPLAALERLGELSLAPLGDDPEPSASSERARRDAPAPAGDHAARAFAEIAEISRSLPGNGQPGARSSSGGAADRFGPPGDGAPEVALELAADDLAHRARKRGRTGDPPPLASGSTPSLVAHLPTPRGAEPPPAAPDRAGAERKPSTPPAGAVGLDVRPADIGRAAPTTTLAPVLALSSSPGWRAPAARSSSAESPGAEERGPGRSVRSARSVLRRLAEPRARLAAGVAIAILLGFLPAHVVASVREARAFRPIDEAVVAAQEAAGTPDEYELLDEVRAQARHAKRDRRRTIFVGSLVIWALVGGAVGYAWFRRVPWDRFA